MTVFVKKGDDVKEIQVEDLSSFYRRGYVKCEKEDVVAPVKKGQKKLDEE